MIERIFNIDTNTVTERPLTESELKAQDTYKLEIEQTISARLEREAKLESALNKLKSLGLTESEAKIIIGLE